jgi:uncharacterized membrane protein YgcG
MSARILLRALSTLVVLCGLVGLGSAAQAAGEIGLSTDGVHWSAALPGPLFDPAFTWVPGDTQTATFYVRNQDADAAVLDVTMLTGPVEALIDTGDLTIGARVDGGAYTEATAAGSHLLVDQIPVASGAMRRIDVRVAFDPTSGNDSQLKAMDLRFQVQLSQDASVLPPNGGSTGGPSGGTGGVSAPGGAGSSGSGGSGGSSSGLPGTGSTITPALLGAAVLLVSGGFLLVGLSRRRGSEAGE